MTASGAKDYFVRYGILGPNSTSAAAIYLKEIQPDLDSAPYSHPSKYIADIWEHVAKSRMSSSMYGSAFELVLACVLIKEGLCPFYMSAEVLHVPNARFDLMFYSEEIGPIALSAKTSLRERYKQADLESLALKAVHRRSKTFLITLDAREAQGVQQKIDSGHVASLSRCVVATSPTFDALITELHTYKMVEAPTLPIVDKGRLVR